MLVIHCYTDRTTQAKQYAVSSFHNNGYSFKGYFDQLGLDSYLKAKKPKQYYFSNVKTKDDLTLKLFQGA